MPGAKALVQTRAARGAKTVLVSGGFTRFAEPVGKEIGFERVVANVLDVDAARLTGTVQLPIVDAIRKREELEKAVETYGIASELTLAVGGGADDILDRKSVGSGKGVSVRVGPGGRRTIKK